MITRITFTKMLALASYAVWLQANKGVWGLRPYFKRSFLHLFKTYYYLKYSPHIND
jgi:hypothetical protein